MHAVCFLLVCVAVMAPVALAQTSYSGVTFTNAAVGGGGVAWVDANNMTGPADDFVASVVLSGGGTQTSEAVTLTTTFSPVVPDDAVITALQANVLGKADNTNCQVVFSLSPAVWNTGGFLSSTGLGFTNVSASNLTGVTGLDVKAGLVLSLTKSGAGVTCDVDTVFLDFMFESAGAKTTGVAGNIVATTGALVNAGTATTTGVAGSGSSTTNAAVTPPGATTGITPSSTGAGSGSGSASSSTGEPSSTTTSGDPSFTTTSTSSAAPRISTPSVVAESSESGTILIIILVIVAVVILVAVFAGIFLRRRRMLFSSGAGGGGGGAAAGRGSTEMVDKETSGRKTTVPPTGTESGESTFDSWGIAWNQNEKHRRAMEDTHYAASKFSYNDQASLFVGVFDGHGGRECAEYVERRLHRNVARALKAAYHMSKRSTNEVDDEPSQALLNGYKSTADYLNANGAGLHDSGCTSVTCLIVRDPNGDLEGGPEAEPARIMYVANIGDARAVLARKGVAQRVSYDHKVEDEGEKQRILDVGGFVVRNKIAGVLAVSRAFGDVELIPYVSSEPFQDRIPLVSGDQLLIVACDGLWDVASDQEAVDLCLEDASRSAQEMADVLLQYALDHDTTDNVSVMVVKLNEGRAQS